MLVKKLLLLGSDNGHVVLNSHFTITKFTVLLTLLWVIISKVEDCDYIWLSNYGENIAVSQFTVARQLLV